MLSLHACSSTADPLHTLLATCAALSAGSSTIMAGCRTASISRGTSAATTQPPIMASKYLARPLRTMEESNMHTCIPCVAFSNSQPVMILTDTPGPGALWTSRMCTPTRTGGNE